jgi:hypothetical protein
VGKPLRKQRDIEDIGPQALFFQREQIEKKRAEPRRPERLGDMVVARAEPAAAAAMREYDQSM